MVLKDQRKEQNGSPDFTGVPSIVIGNIHGMKRDFEEALERDEIGVVLENIGEQLLSERETSEITGHDDDKNTQASNDAGGQAGGERLETGNQQDGIFSAPGVEGTGNEHQASHDEKVSDDDTLSAETKSDDVVREIGLLEDTGELPTAHKEEIETKSRGNPQRFPDPQEVHSTEPVPDMKPAGEADFKVPYPKVPKCSLQVNAGRLLDSSVVSTEMHFDPVRNSSEIESPYGPRSGEGNLNDDFLSLDRSQRSREQLSEFDNHGILTNFKSDGETNDFKTMPLDHERHFEESDGNTDKCSIAESYCQTRIIMKRKAAVVKCTKLFDSLEIHNDSFLFRFYVTCFIAMIYLSLEEVLSTLNFYIFKTSDENAKRTSRRNRRKIVFK